MRPTIAAMLAAVTLAVMLTPSVYAACPNACSGHGTCGQYDSCTCYHNWEGSDCSSRTCAYHWSWITTSKGDMNFDGDTNDATVFDTSTTFATSGNNYVITQQNPNGDWEKWPSTINGHSKDEGHYYMECSNRGTCDRKTGVCKCFEGYTGSACRRTQCPDDCNGRGVCKSIDEQKGATTYTLWDNAMSRSCVCDTGFSGPSCQDRTCPKGNDPLTTDDHYETQYIEIYTAHSTTVDNTFSGTIRLTYTDYEGQEWTTDTIPVGNYAGSNIAGTAMAAALNGLPADIMSGVTVTETFCDQAIAGQYKIAANKVEFATNAAGTYQPETGTDSIRCAHSVAPNTILKVQSDKTYNDKDNTAITSVADEDDIICYKQTDFFCARYKVTFAATPGDLTNLSVDKSKVSVNGQLVENGATVTVTTSDSIEVALNDANGVQASFLKPGLTATKTTCASGCSISGSTITVTGTEGDKYESDERIQVKCDSNVIGSFTVASSTSTTIVVSETIKACSGVAVEVTLLSNVIEINTKLDNIVSVGDRLEIGGFASVPPTIQSFKWDASRTPPGRIFLTGDYTGDDTSDETATTKGSSAVKLYGKGTTESSLCSDRGVCNYETGQCKCFKGYSGVACSTQNNLLN